MRALDLFCGAGGAAMGLYRAGFDVVGVDIEPQPRYPFTFIQADALTLPVDLSAFDFIWASPPCQHASSLRHLQNKDYPALIESIRAILYSAGIPYVIENVVGAALHQPITLCGSMFGLGVWRHRLFESSPQLFLVPQCNHAACPEPIDVTGTGGPFNGIRKTPGGGVSRKPINLAHAGDVLGIDWMRRKELSQAIPPAYSEYIGKTIMQYLRGTP
jgi:DNA (cytosine-5)-methyltransferase 1